MWFENVFLALFCRHCFQTDLFHKNQNAHTDDRARLHAGQRDGRQDGAKQDPRPEGERCDPERFFKTAQLHHFLSVTQHIHIWNDACIGFTKRIFRKENVL